MPDGTARSRRSPGPLAVALTATALALLTACGGPSAQSGSGQAAQPTYQKALAFARCLRTHGEPRWPDPASDGNFSNIQVDTSSPRYSRSYAACAHLRPAGIALREATARQIEVDKKLWDLTRCMRKHGYASFPDLTKGLGTSTKLTGVGAYLHSPFFRTAMKACGAQVGPHGWQF